MQLPAVEMSAFEAILARHSVRSYAEQPVSRATLHTLLEAAVRAPTALHREPVKSIFCCKFASVN
jgi:nitroreductase